MSRFITLTQVAKSPDYSKGAKDYILVETVTKVNVDRILMFMPVSSTESTDNGWNTIVMVEDISGPLTVKETFSDIDEAIERSKE